MDDGPSGRTMGKPFRFARGYRVIVGRRRRKCVQISQQHSIITVIHERRLHENK